MTTTRLEIVTSANTAALETVRTLFREYETWLGLDLCFQGFEAELADLPGKYSMPDGRLFLAFRGDDAVGCIALRPLGDNLCEMKRLFVRPGFQGLGLGKMLIEAVITSAAEIGYKRLRLDTFPPKMGKAVDMYRAYGFVAIDSYYPNPNAETLFMELDLTSYIPRPNPLP